MIHVVGNVAIDTIFRVDRFPLPGETVAAIASSEDLGGKGANQAVVIARAGCPVSIAAAVGAGELSEIAARFRSEGVEASRLRPFDGPTDRSFITVDATGENTIVSASQAALAYDPVAAEVLAGLGVDDVLLCQGNLRLAALVGSLAAARKTGATTVLNASPVFDTAHFDWKLVDVVVVNRVEAEALTGRSDPAGAAHALRAAGAGTVVVTLGRDGAIMVGTETVAVAAPVVATVDTAGAGDVFCGMLVAGRAGGRAWRDALDDAVVAAALSVTRPGVMASFPTAEEIRGIMARTRSDREHLQ